MIPNIFHLFPLNQTIKLVSRVFSVSKNIDHIIETFFVMGQKTEANSVSREYTWCDHTLTVTRGKP